VQAAVIPYRIVDGRAQVALITSAKGRRWILPKGWVAPGEHAWQAAAREAEEEAGLIGEVDRRPIGWYKKAKRRRVCRVEVFLLHVTRELARWDEDGVRDRRWMSIEEAGAVLIPEAAALLSALNRPDLPTRRIA
jgi:8-oxo-dGTP pyrophosphatase MutT (NUDIX family)